MSRRTSRKLQLDDDEARQEFAAACGMNAGWRVEIWKTGPDGVCSLHRQLAADRPWLVIGRSRRCDVVLRKPTISVRHACLQAWNGRLLCLDLDSRLGVRRDVLLPERVGEASAAQVGIGRYIIRVMPDDSKHIASGQSLNLSAEPSPFWLEFLTGSQSGNSPSGQIYQPKQAVTLIGRSAVCKIALQNSSISRVHCSLVRTPSGVWIVDLLSRTGIRVNGRRAAFARLRDGDHLQIGRFEMNCLFEGAEEATSSTACFPPVPQPVEPATQTADPGRVEALPGDTMSGLTVLPGLLPVPVSRDVPQAGPASDFVSALARELAAVQQQMFDQSQQVMTTMAQMVGSLHHSQMQVLREELEQVRYLSRELISLQANTAAVPSDATGKETASILEKAASEAATAASESAEQHPRAEASLVTPLNDQGSHDKDGELLPESEPVADTAPPGIGAEAAEPTPESGDDLSGSSPDSTSVRNRDLPPDAAAPDSDQSSASDREMHLWLHERMANVNRERQTRWQKIMNLLSGGADHAYHKADVPD